MSQIKFILSLITIASIFALLTGCANIKYTHTNADGSKDCVIANRFLWQTEQYSLTLPNGSSIQCSGSKADSEAIKAAVEGSINAMNAAAVKAAITAAAPH